VRGVSEGSTRTTYGSFYYALPHDASELPYLLHAPGLGPCARHTALDGSWPATAHRALARRPGDEFVQWIEYVNRQRRRIP